MVVDSIRKTFLVLTAVLVAGILVGCTGGTDGAPGPVSVAGVRAQPVDPEAVEIAEATLEAMGGREAWERTRYLAWNHLGRREYLWDRWDGRVKVRYPMGDRTVVVSWATDDVDGRAWVGGEPVDDPGWRHDLVREAHEKWVNDSYWLVMPYKILDPGVVLRYDGRAEMLDGRAADVLEMTFEGVGMTPENRFRVYVAQESGLIEQWDVYGTRDDPEPSFRLPWRNWKPYGAILLSDDRGDRKITDIAVREDVPDGAFDHPDRGFGERSG